MVGVILPYIKALGKLGDKLRENLSVIKQDSPCAPAREQLFKL